MKINKALWAFTLIELLVVISIIALLAGIALPVFSSVQVKGAQTAALSNSKQIALACRLYSIDNGGAYPSYTLTNGKPTTTTVSDSNAAFAQLFPDYCQSEDIFWLPKCKFCTQSKPDNKIDNPAQDTPSETLKTGENHWAYVLGLTDSSNPRFPLIADGFESATSHTYSKDETAKGGLWKAKQAIIVRCDSSAGLEKVSSDGTVKLSPEGGDLFGNGETNWLGKGNTVVNPKE